MDIFDAVTTWLERKQDSGSAQIYLSQSSKNQLSAFLELSRDENKLNAWLVENDRKIHKAPTVQVTTPIETETIAAPPVYEVQTPKSPTIEKPGPENNKTMANEPQVVLPLPVLTESVPVAPIMRPVIPLNVPADGDANHSDYLFLKTLSNQTKILIIGEQLSHPQLTEPFEKSKKLLQEMIKAMDNFARKNIQQEINLSWETVSLVEVCKSNYQNQDNLAYIQDQLSQIIKTITPEVVLLMGSLPTEALTGEKSSVLNIHGQWFNFQNVACMPTFHPDFLNRAVSRKKEAWADLQKVIKLLSDRRI